ncbi:MAG: hypothetical protein KDI82_08110 [Gammaproteobacteria bacterium]|nr:hypothetical protein [Gammaproteobacteria bacterium]
METEQEIYEESAVRRVWRIFVLSLGVVLIGFGLWALGGAIYAAWELFRDPDAIAYFARYFLETTKIDSYVKSGGEGLAHYVSWVAVILLLLVLGKLGAWAIEAGTRLMADRPRRAG